MLRAIPLPGESIRMLKLRRDAMNEFQFRMRLWELDLVVKTDEGERDINLAIIRHLVVTQDWPEC